MKEGSGEVAKVSHIGKGYGVKEGSFTRLESEGQGIPVKEEDDELERLRISFIRQAQVISVKEKDLFNLVTVKDLIILLLYLVFV